mmetsp:Transcript_46168/g.104669  ORF Transcript_46168/g.104669 Transcript_46168/m.104669 type:complete len:221 (-) Transcript_46168:930-1592(-)
MVSSSRSVLAAVSSSWRCTRHRASTVEDFSRWPDQPPCQWVRSAVSRPRSFCRDSSMSWKEAAWRLAAAWASRSVRANAVSSRHAASALHFQSFTCLSRSCMATTALYSPTARSSSLAVCIRRRPCAASVVVAAITARHPRRATRSAPRSRRRLAKATCTLRRRHSWSRATRRQGARVMPAVVSEWKKLVNCLATLVKRSCLYSSSPRSRLVASTAPTQP